MIRTLEVMAIALGTAATVAFRRATRGPLRPTWSYQVETLVGVTRRLAEGSLAKGPRWFREALDAVPPILPAELRGLRIEPVDADGVPCRWTWPTHVSPGVPSRAIVYFHGGGYVSGSLDTHRELTARLAAGVGAPVLSVAYRLAPEHRFPAAHDDCLRAVRWLRERGVPTNRIAVAGDSAGGALALATMLALRDAGEPALAGGALLCPWVEPLADGGSMVANAPYDMLARPMAVQWAHAYADEADVTGPRLTLARADLAGISELFVQYGELEVLRDQIAAFVARARTAGVAVTVDAVPEMFHDFQVTASMVPAGAEAVARIVAFLARVLGAHDVR